MTDVAILIVGYRSTGHLPACLAAIPAALGGVTADIRYVDNSGETASERLVRAAFPRATIVPSVGNVGFGQANNLLAEDAEAPWLLLLNPDAAPLLGSIATLVEAAEKARCEIAGGLAISPGGESLPMSRLKMPSTANFLRMIFGLAPPLREADEPVRAEAVSGAFMLIDRKLWRTLGGFDERFFLYAEELDLCRRAAKAGATILHVPDARYIHDVGSGKPVTSERMLYSLRGSATFYAKHFGPARAGLYLALHWLSCWTRFLPAVIASPFSAKARQRARAFRQACTNPASWMRGYAAKGSDPRRG